MSNTNIDVGAAEPVEVPAALLQEFCDATYKQVVGFMATRKLGAPEAYMLTLRGLPMIMFAILIGAMRDRHDEDAQRQVFSDVIDMLPEAMSSAMQTVDTAFERGEVRIMGAPTDA